MLVILVVLNVFKQPIVTSLFAGIVVAFICYFNHMPRTLKAISGEIQESVFSGLKTISITAAAARLRRCGSRHPRISRGHGFRSEP